MGKLTLGKVNAASPTPLTQDGDLDTASAKRLCARYREIKLDGAMLLGTMGEGLYLPEHVRDSFIETMLQEIGDGVTIFASAVDLTRERMQERARRYAGMGAPCVVLCLPPGRPAGKGIADVLSVAESCPVPCAYYDIPSNTGVPLVLNELKQILNHDNIRILKDSSNNPLISQAITSTEHRPKGVALFDGSEYDTVATFAKGYDGALHGGGVLTGIWVREILEAVEAGEWDRAMKLNREKALFLADVYNRFSRPLQNTVGQKYALKILGVFGSEAVVVDQQLDDDSRRRIEKAVEKARGHLTAAS